MIDADGSHRRLLARGGRAPTWSPNSSLIAYRGGTNGSSCGGLRLVDAATGRDASPAAGANPCHQFGPRQVQAPEWSPDRTEIAVGSTSGVYVLNADGTDLRHVNPNSPWSGRPAWRPVYASTPSSTERGPRTAPTVDRSLDRRRSRARALRGVRRSRHAPHRRIERVCFCPPHRPDRLEGIPAGWGRKHVRHLRREPRRIAPPTSHASRCRDHGRSARLVTRRFSHRVRADLQAGLEPADGR